MAPERGPRVAASPKLTALHKSHGLYNVTDHCRSNSSHVGDGPLERAAALNDGRSAKFEELGYADDDGKPAAITIIPYPR
jgi:hypothetical protein